MECYTWYLVNIFGTFAQGEIVIEHAYTKKNIERCIAYKDIKGDVQFRDAASRQAVAEFAMRKIEKNTIFKEPLRKIRIGGKDTFQFNCIHQELASRLISKNIRSNYKIKQQNRQTIVGNLISLLKESYPANVYRFDIKGFFEEVDRPAIIARLLDEGRCSRQTIVLLNEYFKELSNQGIKGLPRGVGISSILAEYVLLNFDNAIRVREEVFFSSRFVDDIVIATSSIISKSDIEELVSTALPKPLVIHKNGPKAAAINIGKATSKATSILKFDYLGYKFMICGHVNTADQVLGNFRRKVQIEISDLKVDRIKSRLIDSFSDYLSGNSNEEKFLLLKNRIKALTGNYYVSDPITGIDIKTGIFFNYSQKNQFINCYLHALDGFLRGLLYSRKHHLSLRIFAKMTESQRSQLKGYSFVCGFHNRRFHFFSHLQLREIKECWRK